MTAPIAILGAGMVTPVGFTAPASSAAIRCTLDSFEDTTFHASSRKPIKGGRVILEKDWRGVARLARMLVPAIRECWQRLPPKMSLGDVPVILCTSERERPGRLADLDGDLWNELQNLTGAQFHQKSSTAAGGRAGILPALEQARALIHADQFPYCIVAGVDSYLMAGTLADYEKQNRLLTEENSDGFIPGEAAAAVLVGPVSEKADGLGLACIGMGQGTEKATLDSGQPLRADGLVQAINAALKEAGCSLGDVDFRITDVNGEQYYFKEATLALARVLRKRKEEFDIWHPVECVGEIGAAMGPLILGYALYAARKNYLPGPIILAHFSNDNGERAAFILKQTHPAGKNN